MNIVRCFATFLGIAGYSLYKGNRIKMAAREKFLTSTKKIECVTAADRDLR